ncbi:MAG TPA: hypothetical protein VNW97_03225 [Candidatus Saccharimonadales bacterium]|nr:hypothetical protein [Candidatus Saccharimonadales bacterium]
MSEIKLITGCESGFEYSKLLDIGTSELNAYSQRVREKFKRFPQDAVGTAEWVLRPYLSLKMLLGATVMMSSLDYCAVRGVRIVEPYLSYYGLLNAARAFLFEIPHVTWNHGELLRANHSKIHNVVTGELKSISTQLSERHAIMCSKAQMAREFFSYRFPAQGLKGEMEQVLGDWTEVHEHSILLAELAQFNSECLQTECGNRELDLEDPESEELLKTFYFYEHRTDEIVDQDDYHRLGDILRKAPSTTVLINKVPPCGFKRHGGGSDANPSSSRNRRFQFFSRSPAK